MQVGDLRIEAAEGPLFHEGLRCRTVLCADINVEIPDLGNPLALVLVGQVDRLHADDAGDPIRA